MGALDIFADVKGVDELVKTYNVTIQVTGNLVGGVPSNESVIRSWLRARMDLADDAIEELVQQTKLARAEEGGKLLTPDDKVNAIMESDLAPSVNGFKRLDSGELAIEGRCLKAGLKEACNSSYPGVDYPGKKGNTTVGARKGLLSTMSERIFVPQEYVGLGVKSSEVSLVAEQGPAWREERIKHVQTPQGPRSAINLVEVVRKPTLSFTVTVHDDFLPREAWAKIWTRWEDLGIGADRGRSDGKFTLVSWEPATSPKRSRTGKR
jgi:hypothetical protein